MATTDIAVEETKEQHCAYCKEKDSYDLTTCDNCNTIFCILCVGTGGSGYTTHDVCPNCKKIFDW
jgi:hypothetical protein